MNTNVISKVQRRIVRLAVGTASTGAMVLSLLVPPAVADPGVVPAPVIPGGPALPGWGAPAMKPAAEPGLLKVVPSNGPVGISTTISGTGAGAGKTVQIVWGTSNVDWILDARPDSVDYLGRKTTPINRVLANATADARGAFSIKLNVPQDFGAIHDIYAVVDGIQIAKGGFLIERTFKITPTSGPVGTKIHVSIRGLGATLYGSSESLYYDSHYGGVATALWTRGSADYVLRAAGPVGPHTITLAGGMQFNYLNYQQSPVPWATGTVQQFTVTSDDGPPAAEIDWPAAITPTISQRTTLADTNLVAGTKATLTLSATSGPIESKTTVTASGLTPGAAIDVVWSTVVGNRVNCTGTCWQFSTLPLAATKAAADGTLKAEITVPDNLGGWHVVQVAQAGKIVAQQPFFVKRSIAEYPKTVKAGERFTVHLKGVGWTQLDNTVAVDYDNSYVGYGCGFNSNGDVVLNLVATGGKGTHLIDIYPLLYTYQPAYPYPPHSMVPFLSYAKDAPGLAVGYQLPAMRIAITVT